ncbi:pilus assembly protein [Thermodesulfobacteriota bacterium]
MESSSKKRRCTGEFISLFLLISLSIYIGGVLTSAMAQTYNIDRYTKLPPFVSREIKPNVIIAYDTSGSMKFPAYVDLDKRGSGGAFQQIHEDFNPQRNYYGYFISGTKYRYDRAREFFVADPSGEWEGGFLNWFTMRRADIARRVMVGGKVSVKTLDQDNQSTTFNQIAPVNRNKAKMTFLVDWKVDWDGWYILEGNNEPYDSFDLGTPHRKRYILSGTSGYTPPDFADNTVFNIPENDNQRFFPTWDSGVTTVRLGPEVEVGLVTMDLPAAGDPWKFVPFLNNYNQPRVVVKTQTSNEADELADPRVQFRDTDGTPINFPGQGSGVTGFWMRLQEWEGPAAAPLDGIHDEEDITYIVVESAKNDGSARRFIEVVMDDTTAPWKFQAKRDAVTVGGLPSGCGTRNQIGSFATPPWKRTNYDAAHNDVNQRPLFFIGVGTWDDGDQDALVTRNLWRSGPPWYSWVTIQENENKDGDTSCTHTTTEYIHAIMVLPPGGISATVDSGSTTYKTMDIRLQAGLKQNVNQNPSTISFSGTTPFTITSSITPWFIADFANFSSGEDYDPANIRVDDVNTSNIKVKIQEETSKDAEIIHSNEDVGWLAVQVIRPDYRIRVGVQEEPTGVIQELADSVRFGLTVYNYEHTLDTEEVYWSVPWVAVGARVKNGGNLYPCFQDRSHPTGVGPPNERTNFDICLPTGVHDPVGNIIWTVEEHPIIWGTTPHAETLVEIMNYIQQADINGDGHYDDGNIQKPTYPSGPLGGPQDPYYYADPDNPGSGQLLSCAKTFVLHFTDGQPFEDWGVGGPHPVALNQDFDGDGDSGDGEHWDDIAFYLRNNDLRGDLPNDHQEIISYYVLAALEFATEDIDDAGTLAAIANALRKTREAAVNGGFNDLDGDHQPDPAHGVQPIVGVPPCPKNEWDQDEDCEPDAFYLATEGEALESKIIKALQSILQRVSSGTAASVISNSRSGEGAIYQSIFFPAFNDQLGNKVEWVGQVHATLVDAFGNTREDTIPDKVLDLNNDKVIVFENENVLKYVDTDGDGQLTDAEKAGQVPEIGTLLDIKFLWSSSDWLNDNTLVPTTQRAYDGTDKRRYIFTFVDADEDMVPDGGGTVPDGGEVVDFVSIADPTAAELIDPTKIFPYIHPYQPYTPPFTVGVDMEFAQITTLISKQTRRVVNHIRGEQQGVLVVDTKSGTSTIPSFRNKQVDYNGDSTLDTWRLGDIINSTPTVVGRPSENYDLIYRDDSYAEFFSEFKDRRNVIYVGANDGMFHAFNGGFFDSANKSFVKQLNGEVQYDLGAELWAYVPYNLLPHLYWLTSTAYTHIYYTDLKPKIFDAKIFPDGTHYVDGDGEPNWGTVLVAGMRFGGGKIAADMNKQDFPTTEVAGDRTMTSAYFIFDITDPESPPILLAEITFPHLGYTTCFPAVIPMKQRDTSNVIHENEWFLIFGSGPAAADGSPDEASLKRAISNQTPKIFLLDLLELGQNGNVVMLDTDGDPKAGSPYYFTEYDTGVEGKVTGFVSDPIAVDWGDPTLDFNTDAVYFGTVMGERTGGEGQWGGQMKRILMPEDPGTEGLGNCEACSISNWIEDSTLADLLGGVNQPGQPIQGTPAVGIDLLGNKWVFFGTGRFFIRDDGSNTDTQSIYGIEDGFVDEVTLANRSTKLFNVTGIKVFEDGEVEFPPPPAPAPPAPFVSLTTTYELLQDAVSGTSGWYFDLPDTGERNIGQPVLFGEIVTLTSYVPSLDRCEFEGETFLFAVDFLTGSAFFESVIGTTDTDASTQGADRVLKRTSLGKGLSITPNIHTGREEGSKAFVQTSIGAIKVIEQANPGITKSGKVSWEEE